MKLVVAVIKPFKRGRIGKGETFVLDLQSAVPIHAGGTGAGAI